MVILSACLILKVQFNSRYRFYNQLLHYCHSIHLLWKYSMRSLKIFEFDLIIFSSDWFLNSPLTVQFIIQTSPLHALSIFHKYKMELTESGRMIPVHPPAKCEPSDEVHHESCSQSQCSYSTVEDVLAWKHLCLTTFCVLALLISFEKSILSLQLSISPHETRLGPRLNCTSN